MLKKWVYPEIKENIVHAMRLKTGLPRFVCILLANRGYTDTESIAALGATTTPALQNPLCFMDMPQAVETIREAIVFGQKICVYGDYDCDGVTATTILCSYLRSVGANATYYIPDRFSEGYGMNKTAIKRIADAGAELIITVDNGVTAFEEITYAKELGLQIIVTDHHSPRETLPDTLVVNPHRADCPSTFKDIAGVGVAFYLVCALANRAAADMLDEYADILAVGTVADVVPLTGDNRYFVRAGLEKISKNSHIGLACLREIAEPGNRLTSRSLAFGIGPRINAAGRMENASEVVELLLSEDAARARKIALHLNELNEERKKIEENIVEAATAQLSAHPKLLQKRILVVAGEGWHQGIIGIAASRLTEQYGRPSIVFSIQNGVAHGSARSIDGVSIINAISSCNNRLITYGGHEQAAGLSIAAEDIGWLIDALDAYCAAHYPIMPLPEVKLDCIVETDEVTIESVAKISELEPFGEGNPVPLFAISAAEIVDVDSLKQDKHQRVHFRKGNKYFSAMWFQMSSAAMPFTIGDRVDMLVQFEVGEYRNMPQLTTIIRDMKPAGFDAGSVSAEYERYLKYRRGECADENEMPTMSVSAAPVKRVYEVVEKRKRVTPPEVVYMKLKLMGDPVSFDTVCIALDMLEEQGKLKKNGSGHLLASS